MLPYQDQCQIITRYLKSVEVYGKHSKERDYPEQWGGKEGKGCKSNFRKAIRGYVLSGAGRLWFTRNTELGGKLHFHFVLPESLPIAFPGNACNFINFS